MSELLGDKENRKRVLKDIIKQLHNGLSYDVARDRVLKEAGNIPMTEIAQIEQELINEGTSPDEIKKFCNVHALLFEAGMVKDMKDPDSPTHPVNLFKQENIKIAEKTAGIRELAANTRLIPLPAAKKAFTKLLTELKQVEVHYLRKENLLFPYLEKYGFMGPSKVMWGKHNDVRNLFKYALAEIEEVKDKDGLKAYIEKSVNPLLEEVDGMIFKEENILLPTSLEKLKPEDWLEIMKQSAEVGYVFIDTPSLVNAEIKDIKKMTEDPASVSTDGMISFPSGRMSVKELTALLNVLPVDITFVDADDSVRYFSESKERIFVRARAIIGRKVQNCHPPQSVHIVEKIVAGFRSGKRDHADFWINMNGRMIYIRYFAVRDENKKFLGTLEVTQDITDIQKLTGQKRLLDEDY